METLKITLTDTKYRDGKFTDVQIEETLIPIALNFNGQNRVCYIRESQLNDGDNRSNKKVYLYNEDGSYANGVYRHGNTGSKMHVEGLEIWAQDRKLISTMSYQNGRVKDSRKYLLSILEN